VTASRSRPSPAPSSPPARRPALVFDRDACHDLPAALAREWLETDGLGGYAALTSLFCPTRRQHGLLVTPYDGQPRRHVFLQRFEETLHVGDRAFPLSLARYPGLFAPHGHATLERFTAVPWPESLHRVGDVTLTREVLMARGTRGVLVRYRCTGAPGPVRLDLRPLLPCRGADDLTHENAALNPRTDARPDRLRWRPYPELPSVVLTVGGAPWTFAAAPVWYRRVEYPVDLARGYDGHEDTFAPGVLTLTLAPGAMVVVAVALDAPLDDPLGRFDREARTRRAAWAASGAAAGGATAATVGGMGLVGSFGGVAIGAAPVAAAGALAGSAVYGAKRAIEDRDPAAVGAVVGGAVAGAGVSAAVGTVGLAVGGTAIAVGMAPVAAVGAVVGLGLYGLKRLLS
jgi:hypothetical protein